MQISCPRCATSYELDERVLPPGGAPVQCTRCSHVFTAHAPSRPGYATRIFGAPQIPVTDSPEADDAPEPPPPEERTQIYGRNAAPEPTPSSAGSRATQIFGSTVGQSPPSHKTQIFGAGSLEATQERPTER
ncbi:MAG TPA: zinc-ribbon domain-containing protein, partial [Myxococcaceae bacterium]|nr:zinc-ribbon domain-containing protein [Myxococcaceae bacterium]